jgi:hypothetical protein
LHGEPGCGSFVNEDRLAPPNMRDGATAPLAEGAMPYAALNALMAPR